MKLLQARRRLANIWGIGAAGVFILLTMWVLGGTLTVNQAAGFISPNLLPILGLVTGTVGLNIVRQTERGGPSERTVDVQFYRWTLAASVLYLIVLVMFILLPPLTAHGLPDAEAATGMLGLAQGTVAFLLGRLFRENGDTE